MDLYRLMNVLCVIVGIVIFLRFERRPANRRHLFAYETRRWRRRHREICVSHQSGGTNKGKGSSFNKYIFGVARAVRSLFTYKVDAEKFCGFSTTIC